MTTKASGKTSVARTSCAFCGKTRTPGAAACRHCGEPVPGGTSAPSAQVVDPDITLVSTTSTVLLVIFTFGLYQIVWLDRTFKMLNARGVTEVTPGKAVGYCFIPIFNIYWFYKIWGEVGRAIEEVYEQNQAEPPSTGIIKLAYVGMPLGMVISLFFPPASVMLNWTVMSIVLAKAQNWLNDLAERRFQKTFSDIDAGVAARCPSCEHGMGPEDAFCSQCGYKLDEEEQAKTRKVAKRQAAEFENTLLCSALRRQSRSNRTFGRILVGVAGLFTFSTVVGLLSPDRAAHPDFLALGVGLLITVGVPGFFGLRNLKQADALKQECIRKYRAAARSRRTSPPAEMRDLQPS